MPQRQREPLQATPDRARAALGALLDDAQNAFDRGDLGAAEATLADALAQAQRAGDDAAQTQAHILRTHCAIVGREIEKAATEAASAVAISRRTGDALLQAKASVMSARVSDSIGECEQALAELEEARDAAVEGDDPGLTFDFHNTLGNVHMALDHHDEAIALGDVALPLAQRMGDLRRLASGTGNLAGRWYSKGLHLQSEGQEEAARAALLRSIALNQEAIPLAERASAQRLNLVHLSNLASALVALGRDDEALEAFARHRALAEALGQPATRAFALLAEAKLQSKRGHRARARELAQEGIDIAERLHVRAILPELYELASQIDEDEGRLAEALRLYKLMYRTRTQSAGEAAERRSRVLAVRLATERALREAATERARADALRSANLALERRAQDLSREALQDALTGLANRRQLDLHLAQAHEAARASGSPACVALLDIDFFKQVNDRYSHGVGDRVLQQLGALIAAQCRGNDLPARCGGEEFVLCWADVALDDAARACERLRRTVEAHDWASLATGLQVTVSIGLADSALYGTPAEALAAADAQLYEAKRGGRNRVCVARPAAGAALSE